MDTLTERPPAPEENVFEQGQLPPGAQAAIVAVAVAVAGLLAATVHVFVGILGGLATYLVVIYGASRRIEGRRRAVDRVVTALIVTAFAMVVAPLVSVIWTVVQRGAARFDTEFFSESMRGVVGEGGGGLHAIYGTLIITAICTLMSVPIGVMVAVYLVEYGRGRLATAVTRMVDVMTGIPSIVAGLFAYALFVVLDGPGHRSGFAGAVALSVLMTPVVIRSAEEMLRLVPNELREASYALGVPKWRTITKVVIPTAIAGIVTGVTLAIATVVGETAPLLLVAGLAQDTNLNPFDGRMTTLPVLAYYEYQTPGVPPQSGYDRAWAAALALVLIVGILFTVARIVAKVLQPKGLR